MNDWLVVHGGFIQMPDGRFSRDDVLVFDLATHTRTMLVASSVPCPTVPQARHPTWDDTRGRGGSGPA
jgi:hypothetical protein